MYGVDCRDRKCSIRCEQARRFLFLPIRSSGLFTSSSSNITSYLVSQVPEISVCRNYSVSVHQYLHNSESVSEELLSKKQSTYLINCMKQSSSLEANSSLPLKSSRALSYPKVHYCDPKNLALVPVLKPDKLSPWLPIILL